MIKRRRLLRLPVRGLLNLQFSTALDIALRVKVIRLRVITHLE